MGIQIPGMTAESLAKTTTDAKVGRRDFPANPNTWTTFTGGVEKVEIKMIGNNENLAIYARNGECLAEILVSLQINDPIPNSQKSLADQAQEKLATLTKAVKTLEIYNAAGEIEPGLFPKAKGRMIAFAGKKTGDRYHDGKTYPKISYVFNGRADELIPVVPYGAQGPASTPAPAGAAPAPFEIPF